MKVAILLTLLVRRVDVLLRPSSFGLLQIDLILLRQPHAPEERRQAPSEP